MNINLLSIGELRRLSEQAGRLATEMEAEKPSYDLARQQGVINSAWKTPASMGWQDDFHGDAVIPMENGSVWHAVGRKSFIDFSKLEITVEELNEMTETHGDRVSAVKQLLSQGKKLPFLGREEMKLEKDGRLVSEYQPRYTSYKYLWEHNHQELLALREKWKYISDHHYLQQWRHIYLLHEKWGEFEKLLPQ